MSLSRSSVIVWSLVLGLVSCVSFAGDPVVTMHYPEELKTGPTPVRGAATLPLNAPTSGVLYFTIDTEYRHSDADGVSPVHTKLHYVLGGLTADSTNGRARVNGPDVRPVKDRSPLVRITDGWLWVSDQPPSGWSGHSSLPHEQPVTAGVFESGVHPVSGSINAQDALGWSIITLLRGEWTWAGAIGTEFIFRVVPRTRDDNRLEIIYGLDSASTSLLTLMNPGKEEIKAAGGRLAGVKGRGAIQSRVTGAWRDGGSHEKFVGKVRDAIAKVGRD